MLTKVKFNRIALAVALSLGITSSALAQETTSGIRGQITTPTGAPASNVSVVVTHVPSGTVKTVSTNDEGAYRLRGLRVGGPYRVEFDSDEFRDQSFDEVYLQLSNVERLSTQLEEDDVERISVTSNRPAFTSTGSNSYFNEFAIQNQTGTTRDIKDLLRANPLVNLQTSSQRAMMIAGANPRLNSITVDGIAQNDNYGLNFSGYPTSRSPLPLDALEQITVDVAPFNAKVSGFTGGIVNAVLKSGTNDFKGGIFYETYSDKNAGTYLDLDGTEQDPFGFEETTVGVSAFGALIEDKLFFAVSYEKFEEPTDGVSTGPTGSAGYGNLTKATVDELNEVYRIAESVYGLSAEQIGGFDAPTVSDTQRYTIKLDWNINQDHRAALTYQNNELIDTKPAFSNPANLNLTSRWYNNSENMDNASLFLYSDWTDNLSTEMSVTVRDVTDVNSINAQMSQVTISKLESGGNIGFGPNADYHFNGTKTKAKTYRFEANYLAGDHSITAGLEYADSDIDNLYGENSLGTYNFNGLEDFENRIASSFVYDNGVGNDPYKVSTQLKQQTFSAYVQDDWDITYDLSMSFGLRYERITTDGAPIYNQASEARTGYRNDANLDGIDIFLPRFGFNYTLNDDTTIRGGIGRYAGGTPGVWIGNAWKDSGVANGSFNTGNESDWVQGTDFIVPTDGLNVIPQVAQDALNNAVNNGNVSFNDPAFEIPSDYRAQIAVDHMLDIPLLGDDYEFTAEYMFIKRKNSAFWSDKSLQSFDIDRIATTGRVLYDDNDFNYDIMLTNAEDGGRSKLLTLQLSKAFDSGFSFDLSYANQDVTEASQGGASNARGSYYFSPVVNREDPRSHLGPGRYSVEHALNLSMTYQKAFFGDYNTTVSMFVSRSSGQSMSHIMSPVEDSAAGRALSPTYTRGSFLPFIPNFVTNADGTETLGDDHVTYANDDIRDQLYSAIKQQGLEQFAGGFVPKGSTSLPWATTVDMKITQDLPGFVKGHSGQVYFTINNVLNLIDNSKGRFYKAGFDSLDLYQVSEYDDQGRPVVSFVNNEQFGIRVQPSVWTARFGIRYNF